MGVERNNRASKVDLASNVTLDQVPSNERSMDVDNLIGCTEKISRNEQKVDMLIKASLRMFTVKNECMKSIAENRVARKRIFFVSSGSMGASIMPDIHEILSRCIYLFCGRIIKHDWAYDYAEYLLMFDHETDIFARLLRDIAKY